MRLEVLKKSLSPFFITESLPTPNSELRTCGLTRRLFLRWLLGFPFLSFFSFPSWQTEAAENSLIAHERRSSIAESFRGEELVYEIGIGPFKRLAEGRLSFRPLRETGHYVATLEAETLGVLGWATRYRVDSYRSTMEEINGGRRFRALSFEEDVKIGDKLRKKIHLFDHQRRKWIMVRRRKDGGVMRSEKEIPQNIIYDDFLTASYNFRHGVYGEIERGKRYTVTTFPQKGNSSYEVRVAGREEEEGRKRSEKMKEEKEFFIELHLDPQITHSKTGVIEGWMSKEFYPITGAIKDVIFFGDVKGKLVKNSRG
jgi:hypothetical protein